MNIKYKIMLILIEIFTFLVVFFSELQGVLLAIGFLILTDTFTGIWAAQKQKQKITSRKAGRILAKLILYPLSIVVAKVAQNYLAPAIPWIDVTAGSIAMVEIKSLFENISVILGYDLWNKIKKAFWKDKLENEI